MAEPDTLILRTGCKINLNLFITGIRPDGWHELDTLFYPLDEPGDELILTFSDTPGIRVRCAEADIDPADNTLTRAHKVFQDATGQAPGLDVTLRKGVPHGMGLGGGSADAAALLDWLNSRAVSPLPDADLKALGLLVGADVPFFLQNRPCRATGLGEALEPASIGLDGVLVLLCPPQTVSTPWAYQAYDRALARPDSSCFLTGSGAQAIRLVSIGAGLPRHALMINDFEPVVCTAFPAVGRCKELLLRHGARAAAMSGSGASVFGLFRTGEAAEAATLAACEQGIRAYAHTISSAA